MSHHEVYVEIPVKIRVTHYTPGRPAVMYLRNGDPGYPDEPAEIEWEIDLTDEQIGALVRAEIERRAESIQEELLDIAAECPPVDDLRDMGLADYAYEGYRESRI